MKTDKLCGQPDTEDLSSVIGDFRFGKCLANRNRLATEGMRQAKDRYLPRSGVMSLAGPFKARTAEG